MIHLKTNAQDILTQWLERKHNEVMNDLENDQIGDLDMIILILKEQSETIKILEDEIMKFQKLLPVVLESSRKT